MVGTPHLDFKELEGNTAGGEGGGRGAGTELPVCAVVLARGALAVDGGQSGCFCSPQGQQAPIGA
jgi:hypothetical protein